MNITELFHRENQIDFLPHWPVYSINDCAHIWYFFSAQKRTLKKKIQNTNIKEFLKINNNNQSLQQLQQSEIEDNDAGVKTISKSNNTNNSYTLLVVRQIDRRQPRDPILNMIKVQKISSSKLSQSAQTQQQIIKNNEWKANTNEQINLYKIQNIQTNKLYCLEWSNNIVNCDAPISSYLKNKLTKYCEHIAEKADRKILKQIGNIIAFQLVFTFDKCNGYIRIVFAHNFAYHTNENVNINNNQKIQNKFMYVTDLKVGKDHYERIQLLINQNKQPKQNNNIDTYNDEQLKRWKYLKTMQKLSNKDNQFSHKLAVALKKQQTKQTNKQSQCQACQALIVIKQGQSQKLVSSNRIAMIQMLRQVKMKRNKNIIGNYQLVSVCQLCYQKFREWMENKTKQEQDVELQEQNKQQKTYSIQPNKSINKNLNRKKVLNSLRIANQNKRHKNMSININISIQPQIIKSKPQQKLNRILYGSNKNMRSKSTTNCTTTKANSSTNVCEQIRKIVQSNNEILENQKYNKTKQQNTNIYNKVMYNRINKRKNSTVYVKQLTTKQSIPQQTTIQKIKQLKKQNNKIYNENKAKRQNKRMYSFDINKNMQNFNQRTSIYQQFKQFVQKQQKQQNKAKIGSENNEDYSIQKYHQRVDSQIENALMEYNGFANIKKYKEKNKYYVGNIRNKWKYYKCNQN